MKLYDTPIGARIHVALFIICTGMLTTQTLAVEVPQTGPTTGVVTELSRQESDPLDRAANAAIGRSQMQARTIVRVKHVKLDVASILNAPTIRMNFFTDVSLVVAQDKVTKTVDGATHWVGHVGTNKIARALFVIKDGKVVGSIHYGIHVYQIRPVQSPSGAVHAIYEIDQTKFPPESHHARPPRSSRPSLGEIARVQPPPAVNPRPTEMTLGDTQALTRVDLLVAYGDDINKQPGAQDIDTEIGVAVDQINLTFIDSGINLFLCLVASVHVPGYRGIASTPGSVLAGSVEKDLDCLLQYNPCGSTNVDAAVVAIRRMRDKKKADLVNVWVESGDKCGRGEAYDGTMMDPELGYSVVNRSGPTSCATSNYSMAHELGHTMGTRHDRTNEGVPNNLNDKINYGHFNVPSSERTIMADQDPGCPGCARIGYWSNLSPLNKYSDSTAPMGVDLLGMNAKNAANNAGTLEANKNIVAGWRTTPLSAAICKNPPLTATSDTTPPGAPSNLGVK